MKILLFIIIHWYLSLAVQTLFLHRYASHRMFILSPFSERLWFLATFILQGSSFLNPAAYAVMHRKHHLKSDTPEDPHTPMHTRNIFTFMLKTRDEYSKTIDELNSGNVTYSDLPRWERLEKIGNSLIVAACFIALYAYIYYLLGAEPWMYIFLPVNILMGPLHGFIVNWFGHRNGYRNYKQLNDNSKNTLPVDLLMMGELYQNNHHYDQNDPNFSRKWFELDLGYIILKILGFTGLIRLSKV